MTRTFIAADLDEAFLDAAAAIPLTLPHGRRVERETMHCTLRFFGEVDDARLEELKALVASLPKDEIGVRATRLDAFSRPAKAHVVVLPLEDDGSLAALHETIGREERPYRPHLTLARLKTPADLRTLVETTPVRLEGRVVRITLYASKLGKNGPMYTPLTG